MSLFTAVDVWTLVRKVIITTVTTLDVRTITNQMPLLFAVTTFNLLSASVSKMTTFATTGTLETVTVINHVPALPTVLTHFGGAVFVNVTTVATTAAPDLFTFRDFVSLLLAIAADQFLRARTTDGTFCI